MFPDNHIAKAFTFSKTKITYDVISDGLSSYFQQSLYEQMKEGNFVTVLFDETLIDIIQENKMDICGHLCDVRSYQTSSRYFCSPFLGHTTAENLKTNFEKTVGIHFL